MNVTEAVGGAELTRAIQLVGGNDSVERSRQGAMAELPNSMKESFEGYIYIYIYILENQWDPKKLLFCFPSIVRFQF